MQKLLTGNEIFDHIADIGFGSSIAILDITRFESIRFLNSLFRNSPHKENILVVSCEPVDTPFQLKRISLDRFHDLTELSIEMEKYRRTVGKHGVIIHYYLPHILVKENEEIVLKMIEYWLTKQPTEETVQFFTLPQATFPFFEKKLQSLVSGAISINILRTDKERCLSFQILRACRPEFHMGEFPFIIEDERLLIKWGEVFTDTLPREEETAIKDRIDYLKTNLYSISISRSGTHGTTEGLNSYDGWLLSQLIGRRLDDIELYFPEDIDEVLRKLAIWNLRGIVKFENAEPRTPSPPKKHLNFRTRFALALPTTISLRLLKGRGEHTIPPNVYNALRRSVQAFVSTRLHEEGLKKELAELETYFQDITARATVIETFSELGEDLRYRFDLKYLPKMVSLALYYGYALKPRIFRISEDLFKIELRDCFICSDLKSDTPVCQLLTGTIVGLCNIVFKRHFSCNEVQCKAAGDRSCVFHLRMK